MKKSDLPKPTDGEMAVLRVLWSRGPCTVRVVWEEINAKQPTGYTTVLKIMQIMAEKGLVERDESARSHVYTTSLSEEQTQRQVVGLLLDRVFAGSARKLVMQALSAKKATREELAEIRKMIDDMEGGAK